MGVWEWPSSRVTRVIDGDTVDAMVTRDLGFEASATFPVRLRLNRINAPKLTTVRGKLAWARLVALVSEVEDLRIVTVKPYAYGGPKDASGEYMAEVMLADGRNVSDVLVSEGLAVYWDGVGPRPADG